MREHYLTDLTDAEWRIIEPHIPLAKGAGRPRKHTLREIINADLLLAQKWLCLAIIAA